MKVVKGDFGGGVPAGPVLEQTQQLADLGLLVGELAHDLNNILTAILGNADLAVHFLSDEERARSLIHEIEKAALTASDLVGQMLLFAGKRTASREILDLTGLVCEMTPLLRVAISKKAIFESESSVSRVPVYGNSTQLRQIVLNLMMNASDALGGGRGGITLRTGLRESGTPQRLDDGNDAPSMRRAYLSIRDTGCGMDAEVQRRLFEPFYTTKRSGRGLGLSVVRDLVHAHGGEIEISSTVGKGTEVTVFFPETKVAPGDPEETASLAADVEQEGWRGSGRALVIDDEIAVCSVAGLMLRELGFDVLETTSGSEGLELFHRHRERISLVLLDKTMPAPDGIEVAEEMQRREPAVPLLLMSGWDEEEARSGFERVRLSGFLKKPFSRSTLARAAQLATTKTASSSGS